MDRLKKICFRIAAFVLILSLAGCSSPGASKKQSKKPLSKPQATSTPTPISTPSPTPTAEPEITSEPSPELTEEILRDNVVDGKIGNVSLDYITNLLFTEFDLEDKYVNMLEENKGNERVCRMLDMYHAMKDADYQAIGKAASDLCADETECLLTMETLWEGYYRYKYYDETAGFRDIEFDDSWRFVCALRQLCVNTTDKADTLIRACNRGHTKISIPKEYMDTLGAAPNGKVLIMAESQSGKKADCIDLAAMAYLPDSLFPESLDEVQYLIIREIGYTEPFTYTNGQTAKKEYADIYLKSCPDGKTLYSCDRIEGGDPPLSITAFETSKKDFGYGDPCDPEALAEGIMACIEKIK